MLHFNRPLPAPRPHPDDPGFFLAAYKDWGVDPFGGGWNFWAPLVDVQAVMERMRRPFPDEAIYIIGGGLLRGAGLGGGGAHDRREDAARVVRPGALRPGSPATTTWDTDRQARRRPPPEPQSIPPLGGRRKDHNRTIPGFGPCGVVRPSTSPRPADQRFLLAPRDAP